MWERANFFSQDTWRAVEKRVEKGVIEGDVRRFDPRNKVFFFVFLCFFFFFLVILDSHW